MLESPRVQPLMLIYMVLLGSSLYFITWNLSSNSEGIFSFMGDDNIKESTMLTKNSKSLGTRENTPNTDFMSGYIFHNNRLRVWYNGKCIDSSDGKTLTVQFCDPDVAQVRYWCDCVCLFVCLSVCLFVWACQLFLSVLN
jgi:hypothetical protein